MLLAGTLVVGLFYLGPAWSDFRALRTGNQELSDISEELDNLIQNRDALINSINTISKDDLARLDRALPQGPHASEFLVSLENLAKQYGIVLKRVDLASFVEAKLKAGGQPRPGGTTLTSPPRGGITAFPATINIIGTYPAFKSFLGALEQNLRIIDIQDISFSTAAKADVFDFTLSAKTYYQ